jgi:hypothetical protein
MPFLHGEYIKASSRPFSGCSRDCEYALVVGGQRAEVYHKSVRFRVVVLMPIWTLVDMTVSAGFYDEVIGASQ